MENNDYISELHYSDDRDGRVQETAEFFTPSYLVQEMLNSLNVDWDNIPDETFIDPTCGSGNFLVELAKRGVHPKNIYGVDLMDDNDDTKAREMNSLTFLIIEEGGWVLSMQQQ